ncbi:MAG: hypothetical protein HUJ95_00255 [Bacteroidales bacterium]|nr:hypothetical protein [Bacteroidales bacterium]
MRHAFIILAHGKFSQLDILLNALEDEDFDIYLHIDALANVPEGYIDSIKAEHKNLILLPRKTLYWGDISLVEAELDAFKNILDAGKAYSHIHLLSGQDLPLKSPQEIKAVFATKSGQQFIDIKPKAKTNYPHVRCWIPLPKYLKYKSGSHIKYRLLKIVNQLAYIGEKVFLMPKWRGLDYDYKMSSQWVSITPSAAEFLVSRRNEILKRYAHAFAPDEFFLASELWNSSFKENIIQDNLRYIKWGAAHSPHPFVIEMKNYDEMLSSGALFARKFDIDIDKEVIQALFRNGTD